MVQTGARYDVERLPYSACIATFSFVAARGMRRGIAVDDLAKALGRVQARNRARPVVGSDRRLGRSVASIGRRHEAQIGGKDLAISSKGSRKALGDALSDIVKERRGGWCGMEGSDTGISRHSRRILAHMTDTQEARILAFERMLKQAVSGRRTRSLEMSFLIGYVASLIAPW